MRVKDEGSPHDPGKCLATWPFIPVVYLLFVVLIMGGLAGVTASGSGS